MRTERGFSVISLLLVLAVAALLYFWVLGGNPAAIQPTPILDVEQGLAAGDATACNGNRRELERSLTTWSVTHPGQPPTLDALRKSGFHVPGCPGGGRMTLEAGRVLCSLHASE